MTSLVDGPAALLRYEDDEDDGDEEDDTEDEYGENITEQIRDSWATMTVGRCAFFRRLYHLGAMRFSVCLIESIVLRRTTYE